MADMAGAALARDAHADAPTRAPKKTEGPLVAALQIADKPSPSAGFLFFNGVMLKTPMPTQHELE
ncbi:hypothetical protein, partial [Burkholderia pseudomallei]|uniref:hypothetical protein n=2 Tax=Burkholderia pseudomallei TaxID=28450 RepID=UPI001C838DE4